MRSSRSMRRDRRRRTSRRSGPAEPMRHPRFVAGPAVSPASTRRPAAAALAALFAAAFLAGCASTARLESPSRGTTQKGLASWYGAQFHGRPTASGEIYDMNRISAAHKQLPLGTVVQVRNRDNGKKLKVPINDRGPFVAGRIIDLSVGAARKLDMFGKGLANVRIKVVRKAPKKRKLPISYPARGGTARKADRDRRGGYTIQAGAFDKRSRAVALARRLRRELDIDNVKVTRGGGVHRVRIERRRRQAADDVLRRLKAAGISAFLMG